MKEPARDGWDACPPGEFSRLAARLRGRRRRRKVLQATVAISLAVLVGSVLYQMRPRGPREFHYAGISCSRVVALAQDYAAGRLSNAQREQVREHVSQCPRCKPLFKSMGMATRSIPRGPEQQEATVARRDPAYRSQPPEREELSAL
jgi:putative zinc finger protein